MFSLYKGKIKWKKNKSSGIAEPVFWKDSLSSFRQQLARLLDHYDKSS